MRYKIKMISLFLGWCLLMGCQLSWINRISFWPRVVYVSAMVLFICCGVGMELYEQHQSINRRREKDLEELARPSQSRLNKEEGDKDV